MSITPPVLKDKHCLVPCPRHLCDCKRGHQFMEPSLLDPNKPEQECVICGRPLLPWEDELCDECIEDPEDYNDYDAVEGGV